MSDLLGDHSRASAHAMQSLVLPILLKAVDFVEPDMPHVSQGLRQVIHPDGR